MTTLPFALMMALEERDDRGLLRVKSQESQQAHLLVPYSCLAFLWASDPFDHDRWHQDQAVINMKRCIIRNVSFRFGLFYNSTLYRVAHEKLK
jgi:hypothetical protein